MRKIIILLIWGFLFSPAFLNDIAQAELAPEEFGLIEPISTETEEGRYVLLMLSGRAYQNTQVPAIILDSVRGIVWTCRNLQDDRPIWVKTDLGQNENKPLSRKKYTVRMLKWQAALNLKMPVVVLDIEEGVVWTCSDIIDKYYIWMQKDLKTGAQKEIRGNVVGSASSGASSGY